MAEFEVDVDIHASIRVEADSEADALDKVSDSVQLITDEPERLFVNSIFPLEAREV